MIWLTGGALAVALLMIAGLLGFILFHGLSTFWPAPIVRVELNDGQVLLGEIVRRESFKDSAGKSGERESLRVGNADLTGTPFVWINIDEIAAPPTRPEWALVVERMEHGRFYGQPTAMLIDGKVIADTPATVWAKYQELHAAARRRWREQNAPVRRLQIEVAPVIDAARLDLKQAELSEGRESGLFRRRADALAAVEVRQNAITADIEKQIAALARKMPVPGCVWKPPRAKPRTCRSNRSCGPCRSINSVF